MRNDAVGDRAFEAYSPPVLQHVASTVYTDLKLNVSINVSPQPAADSEKKLIVGY